MVVVFERFVEDMIGTTLVGSPGDVPLDVLASEKLSRELAPSPGAQPIEMGVPSDISIPC